MVDEVAAGFLASFDRGRGLVQLAGLATAIVRSLGAGNLLYYFISQRRLEHTTKV